MNHRLTETIASIEKYPVLSDVIFCPKLSAKSKLKKLSDMALERINEEVATNENMDGDYQYPPLDIMTELVSLMGCELHNNKHVAESHKSVPVITKCQKPVDAKEQQKVIDEAQMTLLSLRNCLGKLKYLTQSNKQLVKRKRLDDFIDKVGNEVNALEKSILLIQQHKREIDTSILTNALVLQLGKSEDLLRHASLYISQISLT